MREESPHFGLLRGSAYWLRICGKSRDLLAESLSNPSSASAPLRVARHAHNAQTVQSQLADALGRVVQERCVAEPVGRTVLPLRPIGGRTGL